MVENKNRGKWEEGVGDKEEKGYIFIIRKDTEACEVEDMVGIVYGKLRIADPICVEYRNGGK